MKIDGVVSDGRIIAEVRDPPGQHSFYIRPGTKRRIKSFANGQVLIMESLVSVTYCFCCIENHNRCGLW